MNSLTLETLRTSLVWYWRVLFHYSSGLSVAWPYQTGSCPLTRSENSSGPVSRGGEADYEGPGVTSKAAQLGSANSRSRRQRTGQEQR
ncbi:hypothetical protein SKAU_G00299900 [Synaphobranchus kaupii]|uniref:Uncharacterized protein n=1 Tax=Synaphobranchus kaupii TaxID=118154 RepID=A0A9Q1EVL2_SYNKA|nr:hypothetical protein SKAU_G00299900 [Synaphobranchus kaupii]